MYKYGGPFGNNFSPREGGARKGLHSRGRANLSERFGHSTRKLVGLGHWSCANIKDNIYADACPASDRQGISQVEAKMKMNP